MQTQDEVTSVLIHGASVKVSVGKTVTQRDIECAVQSKIFRDWVRGLDPMIPVSEVTIQGIYYRAKEPDPNKVLFIMMVTSVPGRANYCSVLRGPTVVILPVLECDGMEFTIGVMQRRPAVGARFFPETIAGMTDGGDIVAKALDELEEETGGEGQPGIRIRQSDLMQLGPSIEPSPGLLSEPMHFFYFKKHISLADLNRFEGRMTGNPSESEEIILKVIPLDHLPIFAQRDMKAEIAYRRYRDLFPAQKRRRWWGWW